MTLGTQRKLFAIFPANKNTQRLAGLVLVAALASPTRAMSLADLAVKYRSILTSWVEVPDEEWTALRDYLSKRNLLRKYNVGQHRVEVQDWLLADPHLPSGTGSEKEDTSATVDLAVQLGIIWQQTRQRTWAGSYIADLRSNIVQEFAAANRQFNPYFLGDAEKMLLTWLLLRFDGTFMSYLARTLADMSKPVSTPALQDEIKRTISQFIQNLKQQQPTPADTETIRKLEKVAARIQQPTTGRKSIPGRGVTEQTARRAFEDLVYPRLEALVDLDYLAKEDREGYSYIPLTGLQTIASLETDRVQSLLDTTFFRTWRKVHDGAECVGVTEEDARACLYNANQNRKNTMGYTLIDEAVLESNLALRRDGKTLVLERSEANAALLRGTDGKYKVLTSVDRDRKLSAFKMERKLS